jgi:hypothetical protein
VALCDCDRGVLDREVAAAKKRNENVEGYTDIRQLLENRNVDAITTATPDHWHALATIWACQAGKAHASTAHPLLFRRRSESFRREPCGLVQHQRPRCVCGPGPNDSRTAG